MNIPVFPETKVALKGKKALVVGIANGHSIAWGCARAFRALGAELAVTYLDERARPYVEPPRQGASGVHLHAAQCRSRGTNGEGV
jgi:enoyl-[acyl-carrier protein] reductase I